MTRLLPIIAVLVLLATAFVMDRRTIRPQAAQLEAQRAALVQLDEKIAREQERLGRTSADALAAERSLAESVHFESSPAALWLSRIQILQQLLAELPAQGIPEIKLLGPLDWIEVVRTVELDTAESLRGALATARSLGRKRFAQFLQDALRGFTDQSGGELPGEIGELARFLAPPADAAMLERYTLSRTGRLGAKDETLIVEKSVSDMILSVSLTGWGMTNGPNLLPAPGESEMEALERAANALGNALGGTESQAAQFVRSLRELIDRAKPDLDRIFGDTADGEFKLALARFRAAQPGQTPSDFGQLVSHFSDPQKYIDALRPLFAQLDYMHDHQGALPTDPAQLRPYLARPFNPKEAFRGMKLEVTPDGEHGSMSFSFGPR